MSYKVYVISGGPATGKTTTVKELKKQGYRILQEAARYIGDTDKRFIGKSVKQTNKREKAQFQEAIFQFQKKQIENLGRLNRDNKGKKNIKNKDKIIFSDRGLGDTIAYYKVHKLKVPEHILNYALNFKYNGIFILNPLNFYEKDALRQENKREQMKIHNAIIKTYEKIGYKIVFVPFMSIKKRVKFIKKIILQD